MQLSSTRASFILSFALMLICVPAFSQKDPQKEKPQQPKPLSEAEMRKLEKTRMRPPTGASFYLAPVEGGPGRFSMLLTDSGQSYVEESYTLRQLEVIEMVLIEARKFADTAEAVGTTTPIITRFFDKQEPSFIVDVQKMGEQSRFFVTIKSISGRKLTVDTGAMKRGEQDAKGLFFTIMERVQTMRAEAG
jgi:hypothetical protein